MRAWQISSFGVDSLEFVERPTPQPGPGEVLVQVRAISFNYRDLLMVKGLYNPKLKLPRIPCSDGAGEVAAVGEGVTAWKPGDRVAGIFMQNWLDGPLTPAKARGALGGDIDGMLAEYVVLKETGLVRLPEHLSFRGGGHAALRRRHRLECAGRRRPEAGRDRADPGNRRGFDLCPAICAAAWARGCWASPAATRSWSGPTALGLDAGLNYRDNPDWDRWALDQTGGEGVDLVVEVGGVGTLPRSLRALRIGGTIAQVGVLSGAAEPAADPLDPAQAGRIQGIYVGSRKDFRGDEQGHLAGGTAAGGRELPLVAGAGGAGAAWKRAPTSASWC